MNRRTPWIVLVIGLVVISILLPSNPMRMNAPGRDSGVFLYAGQQVLQGSIPYRDVWDHKGPAIYYIDALGLLLANGSRWGVWLLEVVALWAAAALAYLLIQNAFGEGAALLATLLFLMSIRLVLQGGNLTEEYALPFQCAALYLFWRSRKPPHVFQSLFLVGVTAAICVLLRPNMAGVQISIAAYVLLEGVAGRHWRSLLRSIGALATGAAVVLVPVIGYFAWNGALSQLLDAVFRYNTLYSAGAAWAAKASAIYTGLQVLAPASLPFVALLGWLLGWISVVSWPWRERDEQLRPLIGMLLVAFPVELALAGISGRSYWHYYLTWLPVFSVLAGWGISAFVRSISPATVRIGHVRLEASSLWLSALLLTSVFLQPWYLQSLKPPLRAVFQPEDAATRSAVAYLTQNTNRDEYLLMWGAETAVNYLARRRSPTRLAYQLPLVTCGYASNQMAQELLADVMAKKPVIVDTSPTYDKVLPLNAQKARDWARTSHCQPSLPDGLFAMLDTLNAHYRQVAVIEPKHWPVYRYVEGTPQASLAAPGKSTR